MSDVDIARDLSLSAFLERELGIEPKRSGKSLRFSYCPNCGDQGSTPLKLQVQPDDKYYYCHRCHDKGSIIDAAMHLWALDFKTALSKLVEGKSSAVKRVPVDYEKLKKDESERNKKIAEVLQKLLPITERFKDDFRCIQYLNQVRKIPMEVIREAQKRGIVGFLPSDSKKAERLIIEAVGETLLREAGMWKEGAKRPAICYRPIVFFLPAKDAAEFRIIGKPKEGTLKSIRYGTQIKYPFVWRSEEKTEDASIVEGCIDMLSMVALGYKGHVVGVPGCNNWDAEWFKTIKDNLKIKRYIRVFDNDTKSDLNAGQEASMRLKLALDEMGIPNFRKSVPPNVDINEILKSKCAA